MHLQYLVWAGVALVVGRVFIFIYQSLTSPLRSVPGPFWSRFSRLWFLNRVYQGKFEHDNIALHRKYGPVVRVAPNMYSIDSPEVLKTVYHISSKFPKSNWYQGWKHPSPDRWTMFPDNDIKRHSETRKRFQNLYSMSSLVTYENYVDECADIFSRRLTEIAERGKAVNMGHWFQCYAFDVIGNITYSRRFGFLDNGEDVAGLMVALQKAMVYSTLVGVYAELHPYIYKILEKLNIGGAAGRTYLMKFVQERIKQRKAEKETYIEKLDRKDENLPQDFLEKLMMQNQQDPQKVTDYHVWMMGLSNIVAGSDTTAVSLSSTLYNLLRYPKTMQKLRDEIEQFEAAGKCSDPNVTFSQSQAMPYLQAVMKEALRMHSATGLPLWRVVPEGGVEICGQFFPAGSEIGINTWCAHFNEQVFGHDAKYFRPERWLEASGEKLKAMDAYYMPVSEN